MSFNKEQLFDQNKIKNRAIKIDNSLNGKPIIYYLIKGGEIIYIGQTKELSKRILNHTSSKDFDEYSFFQVPTEMLDVLEAELIINFKPVLNKGLPPQPKFWSYDKIKREYGTPKSKVKKAIGRDCIEFNGNLYVVMSEDKHKALKIAGDMACR